MPVGGKTTRTSAARTPGAGIEFLLFAFAAGEQLSEHTAARPAIIHILEGEGELIAGGDAYPARPGTWSRMAPEVKHSLRLGLLCRWRSTCSRASGESRSGHSVGSGWISGTVGVDLSR